MSGRKQPVLVTGGAGFIGSHVVEALLARGDSVVAFDNFDSFYDPATKRWNLADVAGHPRFALVEGDIRDAAARDRVAGHGPFGGIVHLAARAGVRPSIIEPLLYDDVNVRGTSAMLEFARHNCDGHFVFGSSSSVYGATSPVPFSETEPADRPSSPYAATKRSGELACYAHHHLYGTDISCLRFFTVYGPRQRPEMAIHKFARLIDQGRPIEMYGDGNSARDYTFVADIVDGVLRCLDRPNGYQIYNLGTTTVTPLNELATKIANLLERPLRVRHVPDQAGDVPLTFADISKAQNELGYRPSTPIDMGLIVFLDWYRQANARPSTAAAVA